MDIGHIEGATRVLGRPAEWDESRDGKCSGLPVIDVKTPDGMRWMVSAWKPTQAELVALLEGKSLQLWVSGATHPVVSMTVGWEV